MKKPDEIFLKYKLMENNLLGLKVDSFFPDVGLEYVWQTCRNGTAKWETLSISEKNTFFCTCDAPKRIGDKYRCLVVSGKQVKA